MTDPFESSHRKIKRALEHFSNFTREVKEFVGSNPYEKVVEPDPKRPDHLTHKIKLTKPFPMRLGDIAADVVENLRNALDNAGYAIAISAGCPTRNTAFPFAGSLTDLMKHSLGRSKDLPAQIQSLFCGFQPYLGGDDLLWALNEICITDKHKMLIPLGVAVLRHNAAVCRRGYFSMPDPHVWDSAKNEMELVTLGPGAEFDYDFKFTLSVAFNKIKVVDGQPALRVLDELGCKVQSILMAIEAEARRLGCVQ